MSLKILAAAALAALSAASTSPAHATAVALDTWYNFGFQGPSNPLISGAAFLLPTNPAGIAGPDPAWTFLLAGPGAVIFLDLFNSTDQFEIFDFGSSIGVTSLPTPGGACDSDITCAGVDTRYSRGVFALGAGSHSLTGIQTLGTVGGGAFFVSSTPDPQLPQPPTPDVPLPAAFGLQGAVAALGLGAAWFRRRRAPA